MKLLVVSLLSGLMFYLSQGLPDVATLAWFAATPVLWLAYGNASRAQVLLGSTVAFACGQIYLVQCYGGVLPPLALAALILVLCAGFAGAVLFSREAFRRASPWTALLAFPASWTAFEWLFGLASPHATFGALGYAEVSFPAGIQVAALFGVHAVSFLLCLAASAVALLLRGDRRAGAAGIAVCVLALGCGFARLASPELSRVRVVVLADADTWHRENREQTLASEQGAAQVYAAFIRTQPGARVVVIPEGALSMQRSDEKAVLGPLAEAAKDSGAIVLTGTIVPDGEQNRAFALMPDGTVRTYAKRHLLVPLEPGVPGHEPGLLGGGYATQICKDMDFPGTVRDTAAHGIRLMMVPANDFGRDGWIHARMAIMRGVENGFAVVRAAFNGLATVSDAQGRILGQAPTQSPGMVAVVADVPLGPGPTFYTRWGDIFPVLCLLVSGLIGLLLLVCRRTSVIAPSQP